MKKLLSLLLTLCMLLGCIAQAEEIDYTGTWVCTNITEGDMSIDPATLGMMVTMNLNADGTCILEGMDETNHGTWAATADGINVTDSQGDTMHFIHANDMLMSSKLGIMLTFTRVGNAAADAKTVAAFSFTGYWNCTQAIALGTTFNTADLGIEMLFALYEDNTFEMVSGEDVGSGTWSKTATGVVLIASTGAVLSFTLLDNGSISLTQDSTQLIFTLNNEQDGVYMLANVPAEQFMGTWSFEHAERGDEFYTSEELQLVYTLTLAEENGGFMYVNNGVHEITYPIYYELQELEGGGTVADVLLNPENPNEYYEELILMLYSDGQLVWYDYASTEDEVDVFYCFDRLVTESEPGVMDTQDSGILLL